MSSTSSRARSGSSSKAARSDSCEPPPELERRICAVRRTQGFGPHRIQWALGVARSTVYAVLKRHGLHRLDRLHRVTREPVRYEHAVPATCCIST